jgi:hypothetical protein
MTTGNDILDASYRGISADMLAALLADPAWGHPVEILLEGNPIGDAGAAILAAWEGFAQAERVNLADTGIGPSGLAALLASAARPTELHLDENPLGDEGVELLSRSPFVERVHYLGLSCTGLDIASVLAMTQSSHLRSVETLDLAQTQLSEESWRLLRARFGRVLCE